MKLLMTHTHTLRYGNYIPTSLRISDNFPKRSRFTLFTTNKRVTIEVFRETS